MAIDVERMEGYKRTYKFKDADVTMPIMRALPERRGRIIKPLAAIELNRQAKKNKMIFEH